MATVPNMPEKGISRPTPGTPHWRRRGVAVLSAPVLALAILAVSGSGGSVVPAANTDQPLPVGLGADSFVSANQSRCVAAPGAAQGDVAVVNITNTQAKGQGWGALRPSGATPVYNRPATSQYSSVNFAADTPPNPNLAFTTVGPGGQFCYDGARVDHNVALDIAAVIPAANVNAVTPSRLLDTRKGGGLITANSSRCVSVSGASAGDVAVVNITNTQAAGSGWGALRSSDDTPVYSLPSSSQYSSVNFTSNTPPNPNLAVTEVGTDGQFCYDGAVASHHVLLDLSAVIPAAKVNAVTPTRLLDTRTSGSLISANSSRCVKVAGAADGDVAVVNVTNTQAQGRGWGALRSPLETQVYTRPASGQYSSVNFAANTPPNPNLSLAVIDDGEFCYDGAVASHHVALDLAAIIPAANMNAITPTRLLDTRDERPNLDTSFGDAGRVTTPGYVSDAAQQIAVQSDGKIVVAGSVFSDGGSRRLLLVRYTVDGSLDATFGIDGVVTTQQASIARAVALQSDGKLVVAGDPSPDPSSPGDVIPAFPDPVLVARYDTDGSLDSTFGGDGIVTALFGVDVHATAYSVVVQSDGKIVVAGTGQSPSSQPSNLLVAVRFGTEGTS
jgi:uncharacterized delta-60 repeat protein